MYGDSYEILQGKRQLSINSFAICKAQWINASNSCDQLEFMKSVWNYFALMKNS